MTMEQLAESSGVSARAISDMERGHSRAPQQRTLAALAAGLELGAEPLAPGEALLRLLRALEVSPRSIADNDEDRSSQLRSTLGGRRFLLVLDNAGSEAQVRPLLPGDGAGLVVVTSRRTLGGAGGCCGSPAPGRPPARPGRSHPRGPAQPGSAGVPELVPA